MIERVHRTLKNAIIARKQEWLQALPVVLLGLRCVTNEFGASPFSAVTGGELLYPCVAVPGERDPHCTQQFVRELASHMRHLDFSNIGTGTCHTPPEPYVPPTLTKCSHVWVRVDRVKKPLEAQYVGPMKVLERGPKTFVIESPTGVTQRVSVDRLKPAILRNCVDRPAKMQVSRQLSTGAPVSMPPQAPDPPPCNAESETTTRSGRESASRLRLTSYITNTICLFTLLHVYYYCLFPFFFLFLMYLVDIHRCPLLEAPPLVGGMMWWISTLCN